LALADFEHGNDPLDPLRRFIATPLRTRFRVGATRVLVQTNDFRLLPELPLDTATNGVEDKSLEWKLVRDHDAHGLLEEPVLFTGGALTIASMGPACLVGVDREHGELLCFIGAEVDGRTFQEVLVPFFCRLTNEAVETQKCGDLLSERQSTLHG
jgi:hypothetical protein